MRLYVDFDDVVCETARALCELARALFGVRVRYEDIRWFDLRRSFDLDAGQYERLMERAHEEDAILGYAPTPDAVGTLARWRRLGWEVSIVTGRPATSRDVSQRWLERHGIGDVPMVFVDKYQREPPPQPGAARSLTQADLRALSFDVALEDAPSALDWLSAHTPARVFVFDRPWNQTYTPPRGSVTRVCDWPAFERALSV
jgi:uncharacterized protein